MCWGISGKGFGGRGVEDTQFLRCTVCWGIFEREEGNQRAQTTPNVCVCTFWGSLREGVEGEEMRTSYCNVHLSTGAAWRKERAHTVLGVMFVVSLVSVLTVMVLRSGCVCCCTWCVYLVSFVLLLPAMLCVLYVVCVLGKLCPSVTSSVVCVVPVSYTHLTLPTTRMV